MKIYIGHIINGHIRTLTVANSSRISLFDLFVFCICPIFFSIAILYKRIEFRDEIYGLSISVFSIFSALLLSVQIALFGIFQRGWAPKMDEIIDNIQKNNLKERRILLMEVNTNISYLMLMCCFAVTFMLILYLFKLSPVLESSFASFIYIHFFLTLIMVIKRAHALFQKEYEM